MAAHNKTQMVLSHDIASLLVTASSRLWRQLSNLQWSSFIRLSLHFALCRRNLTLCYAVLKLSSFLNTEFRYAVAIFVYAIV